MRSGIIGKKIGSTSFFNDSGTLIPVTLVKIDECVVSGIKTKERDGYFAVQLASIDKKSKNPKINKPQKKLFSSLNNFLLYTELYCLLDLKTGTSNTLDFAILLA